MNDRLKLLFFTLTALAVGMIGWVVASTSYHLYLDHLAVDQWRQQIVESQLKQLQQQQQAPRPPQ